MLREFAKSLRIRCLTPLLFLLPALLPAGRASAGPLLFTLSSPDDLSTLTVGQTAHFDITLSGLAAVEQLVTLTGGVTFNTPLLGAPTAVHAGSIVPHPLANLLDFQTFSAPGEADASFLTFSSSFRSRASSLPSETASLILSRNAAFFLSPPNQSLIPMRLPGDRHSQEVCQRMATSSGWWSASATWNSAAGTIAPPNVLSLVGFATICFAARSCAGE